MNHETNIRLVDAHPKGNGCHHDPFRLLQKLVLCLLPERWTQARMIMKTGPAGSVQSLGKTFHHAAGRAVQNPTLPGVSLKKMFYLRQGCFSFRYRIMQIRPVETADKTSCVIQFQGLADFLAGMRIGGGRDGNTRDLRILVSQHG